MSVILEASRDKPIGLWDLGSSSPFLDRSGYGAAGSLAGTIRRHASLANGCGKAAIVNDTNRAQFDFHTFTTGMEERSFALEAIVRPIDKGAVLEEETLTEQLILGHLDTYDGLVVDGTVISFVTKYVDTGEARASFDIGDLRSVVVQGVHTRAKNSLYVNGELVAEIDISDTQKNDTYLTAGTTLYSGQTLSGNDLALNMVAVYNYPLSSTAARRHAAIARTTVDPGSVAEQFGGTRVITAGQEGNKYLEYLIDEDHEWKDGLMINVGARDGMLLPSEDSGLSKPGYWEAIIPIDTTDATSIFGVSITWEGKGVLVEASIDDGTTWNAIINGGFVESIAPGTNPATTTLMVRASFEGNKEDDDSHLTNLLATGYLTSTNTREGMTVTYVGVPKSLGRYATQIDYTDEWGITLDKTGITIGPPDETAPDAGIGTIELWVRNLGTENGSYLIDIRNFENNDLGYFWRSGNSSWYGSPTNPVYMNGQPSTPDWPVGEWTLIHLVKASLSSTPIRISHSPESKFQIGHVAVYDRQLTADEIAAISDSYTGIPTIRINDASVVNLSTPSEAADIYTHDWSIQAAG